MIEFIHLLQRAAQTAKRSKEFSSDQEIIFDNNLLVDLGEWSGLKINEIKINHKLIQYENDPKINLKRYSQ